MRCAGTVMAWAAITLIGGCECARTEVVVKVDSEVPWGLGRAVQSVTISVRRGGATGPLRSVRTTALGEGGGQLPMLVGVIETLGDTDTPVWIEALGCGDRGGCTAETAVVSQRALVRFVDGQTLELPLLLASACVGVECASDQRCATDMGQCEPATRAQEMVRPFTGNVAPGGDDAAVEDAPGDVGTIADSSLDGGTADLGIVDAEVEDAGPGDIAAPEAGPSDVGWVDVGIVDAGIVDAGIVDIGPQDTGPRDTGPMDTGPQDTGPTEPSITCSTQVSSRTCSGSNGYPPCCVILAVTLPPSCGVQVPIFGCVPN